MPVGSRNQAVPGCGTHHVAVQTRDWNASLRLYQEVLGMQPVAEFGTAERRIMLLDAGDGSHVELFQPTNGTPSPGSSSPNDPVTHFALATTDARTSIEHVRSHGYEITVEPKEVDLGGLAVTVAFFKGPSREVIEFFQEH